MTAGGDAPSGAMHVEKPGMLSTLQDRGRYGHQRLGVPVNGAMDEWSHRIANLLVGNDPDAATLESTLIGPKVRFDRDVLLALTGADMQACIDDVPVPRQRALLVRRGATLRMGACLKGARAYLAVRGGFAGDRVLDSRSTFLRGGFGGVAGRALQAGDRVALGAADSGYPILHAALLRGAAPFVAGPALYVAPHPALLSALRFTRGPQWSHFTPAAQAHFTRDSYRIHARSDRMGYRFEGPELHLRAALEMISEPVDFGTVQIPPDGQPIVLMADRQGAGGYPKIAHVISSDLPALAQAVPGTRVGFDEVSHAEAERVHLEQEDALAALRAAVRMTLHALPAATTPAAPATG
ncbi:biotin-dependent carboxyltransferase family protein [Robbsia sp. Bb-Pol-6]|uniref:Biotin-dependent carboxyltransferase family protein n=1 Tax=Robbsia betulipollinis TaxID=2981849 RepID=A0ABT3ZKN9_9BURK|nr:biotin-dependent carboxyltransferase family protein [Robbsia betulipollinis]MCY0387101.1 biotin-dependent carboxyltransferase family protein [Robbsia betulipollinis]